MDLTNPWALDPDPGLDHQAGDWHTTNLVCAIALSIRARVIVEAGTYHGRTAIALARTLQQEASPFHIWTAETVDNCAKVAQDHVDANGVSEHITIFHGDYLDMLKEVPGDIDLAFIDGGYRYPMAAATRERLSETGLIVVDDMDAASHWTNQEGYWKTRAMASIWLPANRGIVIIAKEGQPYV